jgi:hypothetical protein
MGTLPCVAADDLVQWTFDSSRDGEDSVVQT